MNDGACSPEDDTNLHLNCMLSNQEFREAAQRKLKTSAEVIHLNDQLNRFKTFMATRASPGLYIAFSCSFLF